jgi:hypothetical protein
MLQNTVITSPHLQDIAAEGGVLGSILLDRSVTQAVRDILPAAEAFTRPEHQTLYRVLTDLAGHNKAWDLVLIADGLKQHKALKAIGGGAFFFNKGPGRTPAPGRSRPAGRARRRASFRGLFRRSRVSRPAPSARG